jgi:hypothetical protein
MFLFCCVLFNNHDVLVLLCVVSLFINNFFPSCFSFDLNVQDGKHDGIGTAVYSSGSVYTGAWKEGKRHGAGKVYTIQYTIQCIHMHTINMHIN